MDGDDDNNHSETAQVEKSCFSYGFRPIYYFSRAIGLMPYTVIYNLNGEIQEHRFHIRDALWLLSSFCLYLSVILHVFRDMKLPQDPNSTMYIFILGNNMLLVFCLFFGILVMGINLWNRMRLAEILKNFTLFDKQTASLGSQFNYKWEYRISLLYCIAILLVAILLAITTLGAYTLFEDGHSVGNLVQYCLANLLQVSVPATPSVSYIVLLRNLYKRYVLVNSYLRSQFLDTNEREWFIDSHAVEKSINTIKYIGRQHSFLTVIMKHLNHCYSFQIMIITAYTFIFSVITLYTFYRYVVQRNEQFKELSWLHFQWQFFYFIWMLLIIYMANLVTSEGEHTSEIAHDIINQCHNSNVSLSLTQLSLQIQNHYPVASCGLFEFDWTLLFTMFAATSTYLTILLNIGATSSKNSN